MACIIHAKSAPVSGSRMPDALERRFRKSESDESSEYHAAMVYEVTAVTPNGLQKVTIFYFVFSDFPFFKNIFKLFKFIFQKRKIKIFIPYLPFH